MKRATLSLPRDVKEGDYIPIRVPSTPIQIGSRKNTSEEVIVIADGKILFPETDYDIKNNLLYLKRAAKQGEKLDVIIM